nr:MAG TPA: hypothetical protein [Caudoviricetes sp.]
MTQACVRFLKRAPSVVIDQGRPCFITACRALF